MKTTIVAALCMAFLLTACGSQSPAEMDHIASVRAAMNECLKDHADHCVGGFVRWKEREELSRIYRCPRGHCGLHAIGVVELEDGSLSDNFLGRIDYIILPSDPQWDMAVYKHALQFVKDGPSSHKELDAAS